MDWIRQALTDYGKQLGLDTLAFGQHDVVTLRLASGAWLSIEPHTRGRTEEILVCFAHPLGADAARLRRTSLEKAHRSHGGIHPVQVATRGDGMQTELLTLIRLPHRLFTPQTLSHAVDYLDRWYRELTDAR